MKLEKPKRSFVLSSRVWNNPETPSRLNGQPLAGTRSSESLQQVIEDYQTTLNWTWSDGSRRVRELWIEIPTSSEWPVNLRVAQLVFFSAPPEADPLEIITERILSQGQIVERSVSIGELEIRAEETFDEWARENVPREFKEILSQQLMEHSNVVSTEQKLRERRVKGCLWIPQYVLIEVFPDGSNCEVRPFPNKVDVIKFLKAYLEDIYRGSSEQVEEIKKASSLQELEEICNNFVFDEETGIKTFHVKELV